MKSAREFLKLRDLLIVAGVTVVYLLAAKLGLSAAFVHESVSPVWPPTGVAVAAALWFGYRSLPGVFLGALIANLWLTDVSTATCLGISAGNTLEAAAAVYLMRRFVQTRNPFNRAFDVLKFVILVAIISTAIPATIGNLALCFSGSEAWKDFSWLWLTWWSGDGVGALVITPLILSWLEKPLERWSSARWVEFAVLLCFVALLSATIYTRLILQSGTGRPWGHITIPLLVWAAFRFKTRGVSTAMALASAVAIWGTINGVGSFAIFGKNESLLFLQAYLADLAITSLSLAAIVTESKLAGRNLQGTLSVIRILAESPALPDALPRMLQRICKTFEWEVGAMWQLDEPNHVLRCLKVFPSHASSPTAFEKLSCETTFGRGAGLPGLVWSTLKPLWIPDLATADGFADLPRAPAAAAQSLHSAFAFPIISDEKFVGVMEFFSSEIREPDRAVLDTFTGIGTQIGQFLERKGGEEEREKLLFREQAARNEAEEANRLKDEFLATLSHELRTPLTAMLGWLSMLSSGRLDNETGKHALETVERNARSQAQLIEDLVDVSRIAGGKLKLDIQPVDLNSLIMAAVDIVRPAATGRGVHLQVHTERTLSAIAGDPARLQQVIWNLLSNAVKFTPRDGHVHVFLRRVEAYAEIEVRDTGIGISPHFLPSVFERFRQAESPVTRSHRGLGLGLAIVRHLTELHGGTVTAASDGEGHGSSFIVRIPLALAQLPPSPGRPPEVEATTAQALSGLRVLLVEDEADARELLALTLQISGADVQAVDSAQQAMDEFEVFKPDVLLSDIGLPQESGYELIRKVRAMASDSSKVPAVALTAFASEKDRQLALAAGFHVHLAKPVEPDLLIETIKHLTDGKRARAQ